MTVTSNISLNLRQSNESLHTEEKKVYSLVGSMKQSSRNDHWLPSVLYNITTHYRRCLYLAGTMQFKIKDNMYSRNCTN